MPHSVATFLMFDGNAGAALKFYASVFAGMTVHRMERYGPGEPGPEGTVRRADFSLCGHELVCIDSPIKHPFTFTPSISLFVECADLAELDAAFARLADGGKVLMPPDNFGFSQRFGWVNDRFGVSWQLNLK